MIFHKALSLGLLLFNVSVSETNLDWEPSVVFVLVVVAFIVVYLFKLDILIANYKYNIFKVN